MFQKQIFFSFNSAILLMAALINVVIIKTAFTFNQDFYWALLFSIPALAFAIYYKRIVSKKEVKDAGVIVNRGLPGADKGILSLKTKVNELNVLLGNSQCAQPYLSSLIYVDMFSANHNAAFIRNNITSLNGNNLLKHFHEDIDRAGESSKEVILKICPGYAGCRDHNLNFNPELFRLNASNACVKMIELKLSRPVRRHTVSTQRNRYTEAVINTKYPGIILKPITKHTAFSSAESMVIFLDTLRQLSGKKPVGIRLCIADKKEFHQICYAFRKTEIIPDYIVIEDCSVENILDMPLYEALLFASKTLEIYGLTKEIKIIAAAQIYTALDVLKLIALGADGIIMWNNHLPGNNKKIFKTSPDVFSQDYWQLRNEILRSTIDLINSLGYINIKEITLSSLLPRLNNLEPINTDIDRVHFKGADQEKSFRIIKKAFTEQNRNTVISFN